MKLLMRVAVTAAKVLLGIALLVGVMLWQNSGREPEYKAFSSLESDGGRYILAIEAANPVMPFGPHFVVITVKAASGPEVLVVKKTRLANDGARIGSGNIRIRWIDSDTASVCLRGDEQADAHIQINASTRTVSGRQEPC